MSNTLTNAIATTIVLSLLFGVDSLYAQQFSSVAQQLGVFHTMNSSDGFGGGVSFFDINNDGLDDLTFVLENDSVVVFLNNGAGFTPVSGMPIIQGQTRHAIWVDYDNDGDNDLFVTTFGGGSCRMFRNEGDLVLTDVTNECGLAGLISTNFGATFADYDRDGFLDLYLCRYDGFGSPLEPLKTNALFRNNGDGTFSDVTTAAGVGDGVQLSFMGGWIDFNKDGWPDLYVINDKPGWHNNLYINKTDGTFEVFTEEAGAFMYNDDPMSATFADFDNDGDLDWYSSNTGHSSTRARLMVNQNGQTFVEQAEEYGVALQAWAWGAAFFDFDNDSFLDLFVATGYTLGHWQPEVQSALYRNVQAQHFTQMPDNEFSGGTVAASYGVAVGDIDNNGYPDLAVLNAKNYDSFLFQNNGNGNAFIKVTLEGTVSNAMAIGSWITVYANGRQYVHYTRCGENYCGQNSQHHIFGLANASIVDAIEIEFPSGHVDTYYNLDVNQHYTFVEGGSLAAPIEATQTVLCDDETATITADPSIIPSWSNGSNETAITVSEPGLYSYSYTTNHGITVHSDTVEVVASQNPNPSINTTPPTCHGYSDGSIEVVFNDDADETVLSINGQPSDGIINSLTAGTYTIELVTPSGCSYLYGADLPEPAPFDAVGIVDPILCNGEMAQVQVLTFGGVPPYTVYWNGLETNALSPGAYEMIIIDSMGCEAGGFYQVTEPQELVGALVLNDDMLSVDVSGGTPPYDVTFFSPAGTMVDSPVALTDEGAYHIHITDSHNCQLELTHYHTLTFVNNRKVERAVIYPNPTDGLLTIDAKNSDLREIVLFDVSGRMVLNRDGVNNSKVILQLNELPSGIYTVHIITHHGDRTVHQLVLR